MCVRATGASCELQNAMYVRFGIICMEHANTLHHIQSDPHQQTSVCASILTMFVHRSMFTAAVETRRRLNIVYMHYACSLSADTSSIHIIQSISSCQSATGRSCWLLLLYITFACFTFAVLLLACSFLFVHSFVRSSFSSSSVHSGKQNPS